jgi:hypothetical protein
VFYHHMRGRSISRVEHARAGCLVVQALLFCRSCVGWPGFGALTRFF